MDGAWVVTAGELSRCTGLAPSRPRLGAQRQALPGSGVGCTSVAQARSAGGVGCKTPSSIAGQVGLCPLPCNWPVHLAQPWRGHIGQVAQDCPLLEGPNVGLGALEHGGRGRTPRDSGEGQRVSLRPQAIVHPQRHSDGPGEAGLGCRQGPLTESIAVLPWGGTSVSPVGFGSPEPSAGEGAHRLEAWGPQNTRQDGCGVGVLGGDHLADHGDTAGLREGWAGTRGGGQMV